MTKVVCAALSFVMAGSLVVGFSSGARADDLDNKKNDVQQQINQNNDELSQSQNALSAATTALQASNQKLADAQAALSAKQTALSQAQAKDAALAEQVSAAQDALDAANAALAKAQADVVSQQHEIASTVQVANQQDPTLLSLSLLLSSAGSASLNNSVQWATTMFDTSQATLDRLNSVQTQMTTAQQAAQAAEQELVAKKAEAAAQVATTQKLVAQAQAAQQAVATQVAANQQAKDAASAALAQAQADQKALNDEMNSILAQIQARIAAQKAAEEAAARAAAAKAAAAKAAASKTTPSTSGNSGGTVSAGAPAPTSGTFFQPPITGALRVTSPFGYRTDPITGAVAYHSGVDLAAPCGTPVHAAADGTVVSAGWYGTLGNYLLIDNGKIAGTYWSTGYGHLSQFLVSAGQHVTRGQVVALSGTTGRSTGCHVHFNAIKNGANINGWPLIS